MHDRIRAGYRHRFRALLAQVRPRLLEKGVELLMSRAEARSLRDGIPVPRTLLELYEATRVRVARRVKLTAGCSLNPFPQAAPEPGSIRFVCDESLGGLARWLRAAGYEARGLRGLRGDALIAEARRDGGILLATDSRLWERRAVLGGAVRALWLPSGMDPVCQLEMVMKDLDLKLREPRCMACGGALSAVAKPSVAERIPPRTARWKDDYFVCSSCGQLFWQGTHWERIEPRLRAAALA